MFDAKNAPQTHVVSGKTRARIYINIDDSAPRKFVFFKIMKQMSNASYQELQQASFHCSADCAGNAGPEDARLRFQIDFGVHNYTAETFARHKSVERPAQSKSSIKPKPKEIFSELSQKQAITVHQGTNILA